jgi:hypothetical protein
MFQKRKTLIYIIILSVIAFASFVSSSKAALQNITLNGMSITSWPWATSTDGIYFSNNIGIGTTADNAYKMNIYNSDNSGIYSLVSGSYGVYGQSYNDTGIYGYGPSNGVYGYSDSNNGISGDGYYYGGNFYSNNDTGVFSSGSNYGVNANGGYTGVYGNGSDIGVMGTGNYGVYASGGTYDFYAASGNRSYFSGKLGIGVDNNAAKLAVAGDIDLPNANYWRYIKNSAQNGGLRLGTGNGSGTYTDGIEISSGGGYIKLHHNVGIGLGSASPATKLDVGGDIRENGSLLSAKYAAISHKYHSFSAGQYFFDGISQGNFFRLFTENSFSDQVRFQPISNVEYYNGSSWVSWVGGDAYVKTLLDGREDTTVSIDHAHRKFRFTVTKNSGWGLTTLVVLQSTWTGLTYPGVTLGIESWNGSSWVAKDTAVFSSPNTANDFGIHAKAVSLHDGYADSRVTIDINDWTDSGSYTTIPLKRFMILSQYSGNPLEPWKWNYDKEMSLLGSLRVLGSANSSIAGNLGVGTANPGYKLDVQGGQINASGGLCIAGSCKTAWSQVTGDSHWTLSGSSLYASSTSYNVGIGTTNPGYKLEVIGDNNSEAVNVYNQDYSAINAWSEYENGVYAGSNDGYGLYAKSNNSNAIYAYSNSDSIYSYSPSGVAIVAHSASGYGIFSDAPKNYFSGSVGIGTSNPAVNFHTYGNLAGMVKGRLENASASGRAIFEVKSSSAFFDMRAHGSSYSETVLGQSMTNSSAIMGQNGKLVIGTPQANPLIFGTNNATRMTIDQWGNLTTNNELYVVGGMHAYNYYNQDGGAFIGNNGNYSGNEIGLYEENNGNAIAVMDFSDNKMYYGASYLQADLNTGYISMPWSRLGIGTQSPGAKLNVVEDSGVVHGPSQGSFILDHNNNGGASSIVFRSKTDRGGDYGYIQYQDAATVGGGGESARLILGTSNDTDDHLILQPTGNVGIGTLNPGAYKVDVVGQVNASTGLCIGGDCKASWAQVIGLSDGASFNDLYANSILATNYGNNFLKDLFAFNAPNTYETYNGSTWTSGTVNNSVFDGNASNRWGNLDITSGTTQVRFTWNSFGYRWWDALSLTHSTNGNSFTVTMQGSNDGTNWTTYFTTPSYSGWPGYSVFKKAINNNGSQPFLRLIITPTWNNSNNINIGNISLMGSYGGYSSLYDWDYSKNVSFKNNVIIPGSVGIGTTSSTYKLAVEGAVGAQSFTYTSDRTLKKNIATIESPLTKILKLRGVTFNWKKDNTASVGLIAQEVEKVFPELVSESNGIKSVQYGNLVAPLIEAVKEQQKEINNLKNRIELLENKK